MAVSLVLPLWGGCSRGRSSVQGTAPPQLDLGDARCSVAAGNRTPFVVEWAGSDRARLESAIRRGVVAVRYQGCEIEVLSDCTAPATYEYAALTPKKESVEVHDANELYARFPRGAVRLEAELERAGSLSVDMMLVGRHEAPSIRVEREQLKGSSCVQATHVVTGLTVGAFRLHTGAKEDIEVDLSVGAEAGAGLQRQSAREDLGSDGDVDACVGASTRDTTPPEGCGALIRIEVVPLGDFERHREVADAQRPLYAHGAPWRKPAVIGTATLAVGVVGLAVMTVGIVVASNAEDPFDDAMPDPARQRAGTAVAVLGAIAYFGGLPTGVTFLSIAGVRKHRAKKAAGLALTPAGLQLRF